VGFEVQDRDSTRPWRRRRPCAPSALDQKIVLEMQPQSSQRRTDRRLSEIEPFRRSADVLDGQEGIQNHQQIEVEIAKAHVP